MTEILSLKPQDKERLNFYALERFIDWQDRIIREVPQLRQLNIEQIRADLDTYLYDNKRVEFNNCLADITRWLSGCMDTGDGYFPYAYYTRVIDPMFRVRSLLIKAYQAKEAIEQLSELFNANWAHHTECYSVQGGNTVRLGKTFPLVVRDTS